MIASRSDVIVIGEVKCRSSDYFGSPALAVGYDKQRRLRRLAATWLAESRLSHRTVRFDVVEVVVSGENVRINVIESAF